MKYKIALTTEDNAQIIVRITAKNEGNALKRLNHQADFSEWLNGRKITNIDVQQDPQYRGEPLFFDTCSLSQAETGSGTYQLMHNPTGVVVEFNKHAFNKTAHTISDTSELDAITAASAQKEIADWLQLYRPTLVWPVRLTAEQRFINQLSVALDFAGYTPEDAEHVSTIPAFKIQKMLDGETKFIRFTKGGTLFDLADALGYDLQFVSKEHGYNKEGGR